MQHSLATVSLSGSTNGVFVRLEQIETRIGRLDALARGLAKEVLLWKFCNDPQLYRERKAYLENIR
jgi:hypothetical protein